MGLTSVIAIITAFLDSAVISLSTQYPLQVQEYFQLGVGVSTLIGSLYRDCTKLVFPSSMLVASSLLYFYVGAITIGFCIFSFSRLMALKISAKALLNAVQLREEEEEHRSLSRNSSNNAIATESTLLLEVKNDTIRSKTEKTKSRKLMVFRKIWFNELMVCLLFMSTLALWPPLVTEIPVYTYFNLEASSWWSLILLTVFSAMDCLGRLLVRFRCGLNNQNIWKVVLGRAFVLFPLIICSVMGVIFTHDLFSVFFVSLLGFTNGYVGTMCIIFVNECLDNKEDQAIAGTFTSFFLNLGLVIGASIGLALNGFSK